MTEQEWLTCTDPSTMLEFVRETVSERKLRLFAVACCRHVARLFTEECSQDVLNLAERYADSQATELELLLSIARSKYGGDTFADYPRWDELADLAVRHAAFSEEGPFKIKILTAVPVTIACCIASHDFPEFDDEAQFEMRWQTSAVREVFGNPFRSPTVESRWLSSTVIDLADAIYMERAFDRLPILADALTDAGCDDEDIIKHCRSEGAHVRGCWVVDLLLG